MRPDFGLRGAGDRRRGDRDLRDPRRAPARDRAGGGADGGDERGRGQGSARRSVPAVEGVDAGPGTTAHAPPRGGVVLRPADRRRAGAAPPDVGLRRRLRPDEHLRGGRRRRRRRRAPAPRLAGPQVARRRRPHRDPHPVQPLRDHPPVRRGPVGGDGRARADARPARRALRRGRRPRDGSTGTGPGGATRSTGWRPSSATCVPASGGARRRGELEVATDIAAHAALMGFSVQLFETLAWAEELLEPAAAADVRRLPRLYTAAGYACFAGPGRGRARERAPGDRAGGRRPLRRVRARVRLVRRGAGRRSTAATSTATSSSPARWRSAYGSDRGYGLASYVDGLQSCGRIEEALALDRGVGRRARDRSATPTGSPTRSGSPGWRSPRRTCAARSRRGTRASPSCASTASSSSRASSPATRPACTPPTASPRPRWCCSPTPSPRSTGPATCRS